MDKIMVGITDNLYAGPFQQRHICIGLKTVLQIIFKIAYYSRDRITVDLFAQL